jgi:predicted metal-dependent hydrolase
MSPGDPPSPLPEPALEPGERRAFERGVAQYNAGSFFECHDTLEDLWSGLRGPARDFLQGLIQVAVAFHHLSHGNPAGARSLLARALARFARYPPRYYGFDLEAHREELRAWQQRVAAGAATDFTPDQAPRWRFDPR